MVVYLVWYTTHNCHEELLGVFSSENKALDFIVSGGEDRQINSDIVEVKVR